VNVVGSVPVVALSFPETSESLGHSLVHVSDADGRENVADRNRHREEIAEESQRRPREQLPNGIADPKVGAENDSHEGIRWMRAVAGEAAGERLDPEPRGEPFDQQLS